MKKLLASLTSLLHMTAISLCAPSEVTHRNSTTTYDQRQVGKYNIHFNIKDVSIIALSSDLDQIGDSDSYADYYDYEDSEYTVNPVTADLSGRPTTKKPNVTQTHPLLPSIAGLNLSSITTSTDAPASIPETVVVIHEKPSIQLENDTQINKITESSSVIYQPDEIPVQIIVEPLLKPKTRPPQSMKRKLSNRQVSGKAEDDGNDDDKIRPRRRRAQIRERIRSRRAHNKISRNSISNGCGRGETSDGQGGCRIRRSGMSDFLGFLTKFLPQRDSE